MTLSVVPTPLAAPFVTPELREGGWPKALDAALVQAAGTDAARAQLAQPGALVVTTGQQPALFTGPLYTVFKALSAAALARQLAARWQRPVVPIFWSAGDDHDFAEANHANWLAADGALRTAVLRERAPDAPLTPLWREPLGEEVRAALAALAADLAPSEFRDGVLAWLERHYRPEATVAAADATALAELLAPTGVLVLNSCHAAVKQAAAPWLLRALVQSQELDRDLARQGASLTDLGRPPSVAVGDGATLVMLEGTLGRDRLVRDGDAFMLRRSKERVTLPELQRLIAEAPERFSPNVLLRPAVESALLPTVAYVAGPGELRYLELTPPIYQRLDVHRQQPVPRWSGVLVEPRVERVLAKFGIALAELLEPEGAVEARLVRTQLSEATLGEFVAVRDAILRGYERIAAEALAIDPTLARPIEGAKQTALSGVHDVEKKIMQHLKKRQETELHQIGRARAAVLPAGKPQERVLTVAPFLARYGFGLVQELLAAIEPWYDQRLEGRLVAP